VYCTITYRKYKKMSEKHVAYCLINSALLRNKDHNLRLANIFDLRSTATKTLLVGPRHNLADFYYTGTRVLIT
jgi:hypothetical protein